MRVGEYFRKVKAKFTLGDRHEPAYFFNPLFEYTALESAKSARGSFQRSIMNTPNRGTEWFLQEVFRLCNEMYRPAEGMGGENNFFDTLSKGVPYSLAHELHSRAFQNAFRYK